jgi:hypothetical protein
MGNVQHNIGIMSDTLSQTFRESLHTHGQERRFPGTECTKHPFLARRLKLPLKIIAVKVKQNLLMTCIGVSVGGSELFSLDATVGAIIFSKFSKSARVLG